MKGLYVRLANGISLCRRALAVALVFLLFSVVGSAHATTTVWSYSASWGVGTGFATEQAACEAGATYYHGNILGTAYVSNEGHCTSGAYNGSTQPLIDIQFSAGSPSSCLIRVRDCNYPVNGIVETKSPGLLTFSAPSPTNNLDAFCADQAGLEPPFQTGTFNAEEGLGICSYGCYYELSPNAPSGGLDGIKFKTTADGSGPYYAKRTTGDYRGTGQVCTGDNAPPEAADAQEPAKLPPAGKCPGVGSVPGGGTATMFVDCKFSESTSSGSTTRSITTGSGTAVVQDDSKSTTTCAAGVCTTTINQTTTVVSGGNTGLTTGDKVTATKTVTGSGDVAGSDGTGEEDGDCPRDTKRVKCATLDVPSSPGIPRSSQSISYAEHVWTTWTTEGSCPSDKSVNLPVMSSPVVLSYASTCDTLYNFVRPLILALAAFSAAVILYKPT